VARELFDSVRAGASFLADAVFDVAGRREQRLPGASPGIDPRWNPAGTAPLALAATGAYLATSLDRTRGRAARNCRSRGALLELSVRSTYPHFEKRVKIGFAVPARLRECAESGPEIAGFPADCNASTSRAAREISLRAPMLTLA
jgi:hypothetical protein